MATDRGNTEGHDNGCSCPLVEEIGKEICSLPPGHPVREDLEARLALVLEMVKDKVREVSRDHK